MTDYPRLEEAWIWPEKIERWFRKRIDGHTLHVCCGRSQLGDVRVDRDPENGPDVVADMFGLPFPDATFDTVVSDPPWKIDIFDRHKWYFEIVRVTAPDGKLLLNTRWLPNSKQTQLEELYVRQNNDKSGHSFLMQHRRWPGQQTLTESMP